MAIQATGEEAEFIARLRAEVGDIADRAGRRCVAVVARTMTDRDAWFAISGDLAQDLKCKACRDPEGFGRFVASAALTARCLAEGDWEGVMSPILSAQVSLARRMLRVAATVPALHTLVAGYHKRLSWEGYEHFEGSPTLVAFVIARRAEGCGIVADLARDLDAIDATSAPSPAP